MLAAAAAFSACNHGRPCVQVGLMEDIFTRGGVGEPYGATDISAVTGNGGLTVALNEAGTITVFKWPNPSYYDQVKYLTTTREAPRLGALANEGVFTGLYYETDAGPGFVWLRDLPHEQSYEGATSIGVVTEFREDKLGLEIRQADFVEPEADLLWRYYSVEKAPNSKVKSARMVFYANFAPQVSKLTSLPIQDWCLDNLSDSTLRWKADQDLFVQFKEGKDRSTGRPSSVYLAFGLDQKSSSHQAGYDRIASCRRDPKKKDAYLLAKTGRLPGSDFARGKVTAGLVQELELTDSDGAAAGALLISAASSETEAVKRVEQGRKLTPLQRKGDAVNDFWKERLVKVALPAPGDKRIRSLALNSIKLILLGYSKDSGAGVASISTQPPYGLDWQRDGAFTNLALIKAGFPDLVRKRNLFWARVQSQPGHKIPRVPEGNWASNYYADGTPGFPIVWWEIDETGWALWSLAGYFEETRDRAYLAEVYPAIRRAADFLVRFKDPKTGLPKKAHEDDNPLTRQSTHGAVPCYLGLKHAAMAAEAMGDPESKAKWERRAEELKQAILENFYDPVCGRWVYWARDKGRCAVGGAGSDAGLLLWPGELFAPGDPRAEQAAEQAWQALEPSFTGKRNRGMYEPYGLLILAHYWKDRPEKLALVKQGLQWEATVPITRTGLLGEIWLTVDGKIVPAQGQPQLWHHALFYLAALEAFGAEGRPY
jgi:GH15 family glucan-1,4-alpha-glucosidase